MIVVRLFEIVLNTNMNVKSPIALPTTLQHKYHQKFILIDPATKHNMSSGNIGNKTVKRYTAFVFFDCNTFCHLLYSSSLPAHHMTAFLPHLSPMKYVITTPNKMTPSVKKYSNTNWSGYIFMLVIVINVDGIGITTTCKN